MRIIRPKLRAEYRGQQCEYCRKTGPCEAAHVFAKGMGGGKTMDIRCNLVALGHAFSCACHASNHAGHEPTHDDLLLVVAVRERVKQDDIIDMVHWLRRLDKSASREKIERALRELRGGARRLAIRELVEAGKI